MNHYNIDLLKLPSLPLTERRERKQREDNQ
jgi:hypothetical protein